MTHVEARLSSWDPTAVFSANMLSFLLQGLASCGIMLGGVVPYIPQYLDIKRTKNADGFSTYVCLTLLVANTLRILFWFGHPFELPLLAQSVIMNACMLFMIHACVSVRGSSDIIASSRQKHFTDFKLVDFWQWTDFISYVQFLFTFALVTGALTLYFMTSSTYVVSLGLCALLSEAMLGVPQFYRNYQNRSTEGMSISMVLLWTCGDVLKTVYFVARDAPVQFWLCGALQVCLDIAILLQVAIYTS